VFVISSLWHEVCILKEGWSIIPCPKRLVKLYFNLFLLEVFMDNFAPTIKIDGQTITPKGYAWVLGFALAGCDWAIKEASKPEFLDAIRRQETADEVSQLEKYITTLEQ